MPNLLKKCVTCYEMRDSEKEFHFNEQHYSDGIKKKRLDCVYCCKKRRAEYFNNPEKRKSIGAKIYKLIMALEKIEADEML